MPRRSRRLEGRGVVSEHEDVASAPEGVVPQERDVAEGLHVTDRLFLAIAKPCSIPGMEEVATVVARRLAELFIALGNADDAALAALEALYTDDMVFTDPLQTVHGRAAFTAMNRRLLGRARRITVEVGDAVGSGDNVFLSWKMVFVPKIGPTLSIDGATHAKLRGALIERHRDYWDLASTVAESLPVVRSIYAGITPYLG